MPCQDRDAAQVVAAQPWTAHIEDVTICCFTFKAVSKSMLLLMPLRP
jgi:hypothetical protein